MGEKAQISNRHLWAMTVINTLCGTLLLLPATAIDAGGRAAWMVAILAGIVGFLTVLLIGKVGQRFPNVTFVGYASKILSPWIGKPMAVIFVVLLTLNAAVDLRLALKSILGVYFYTTPVWVISVMLAVTALSASWFGVISLARLGPLFAFWLGLTFLFTFPALFRWMQPGYLIPVFDATQIDLVSGSFWVALSSFRVGLLLAGLMPYVKDPKTAVRTYGKAFWFGWLAVLPAVVVPVLVFGPHGAREINLPFPYVVSIIRIPNFPFERVEMFARLAYNVNILYGVGAAYFVGGLLLSEVFNTQRVRPFMLAMASLSALSITLILSDKITQALTSWIVLLTMCFTWLLFPLLWLIARIRGLGQKRKPPASSPRASL